MSSHPSAGGTTLSELTLNLSFNTWNVPAGFMTLHLDNQGPVCREHEGDGGGGGVRGFTHAECGSTSEAGDVSCPAVKPAGSIGGGQQKSLDDLSSVTGKLES